MRNLISILGILFFSSISLGQNSWNTPDALPRTFVENFNYDVRTGEISKKNPNVKSPLFVLEQDDKKGIRAYEANSGLIQWSVSSSDCKQNKSLTCMSIYDFKNSEVKGSQHNPMADINQKGEFILYQLDKKSPTKNIVVKCDSEFLSVGGVGFDKRDLSSCAAYSKSSCEKWRKEYKKISSDFNQLMATAEKCSNFMGQLDGLRDKMNSVFKEPFQENGKLKAEISEAFGQATNEAMLSSKTKVAPLKPFEKSVLVFQELNDKNENCEMYEWTMFSEKSPYQRVVESIGSTTPKSNGSFEKGNIPQAKQ